jgi:hypothetical protein
MHDLLSKGHKKTEECEYRFNFKILTELTSRNGQSTVHRGYGYRQLPFVLCNYSVIYGRASFYLCKMFSLRSAGRRAPAVASQVGHRWVTGRVQVGRW